MSIESVVPSKYFILCHPLFLLNYIFPSVKVFSSESALHIRWPKYWSSGFDSGSFKKYSRLISFRTGWFDLHAVQGILKSLLQHHSSKAPILRCSAFFMVQLSRPYMTTRKTVALTRHIFVSRVMSLLFNMLSRLVIVLLSRSKHLNFMGAVTICSDFGAQENNPGSYLYHLPPRLLQLPPIKSVLHMNN